MRILPKKSLSVNTSYFLDQFAIERRSLIANQFFAAVREGSNTVDEVLCSVKADALRRMMFPENRERWNAQRQLVSLLESAEARVYAQEVLDRELLSPEEKQRIKAERSEQYRREYLKAQEPTERQIRFLRSRGCQTMPTNRWEASVMIDGHIKG